MIAETVGGSGVSGVSTGGVLPLTVSNALSLPSFSALIVTLSSRYSSATIPHTHCESMLHLREW